MASRLTVTARANAAALIAVASAVLIAACGGSTAPPSVGPSPSPSPVTSVAAQATRAEIARALGARSIGLDDAEAPYRPPETPDLAGSPRLVLEAFLPDDPTAGQIVVYELSSAARADEAGREFAAWISSGPGRVNFTPDSRFVLRALGPTLVFFSYAPGSLQDPAAAAELAEALATVGTGIDVAG
jgi:hypothetical protein